MASTFLVEQLKQDAAIYRLRAKQEDNPELTRLADELEADIELLRQPSVRILHGVKPGEVIHL